VTTSALYRPDIDGLRALAVVPVILFHAGMPWVPGGFAGVDVFFVISGFLITSILQREIRAGTFSFRRFYERRARRIIPALLVMMLVTVAVFQLIALPEQAEGAARSALAALVSVSNIHFWLISGYFAPATEFMPLLHTWSLGVEEQFYIVFPIVLLWLVRKVPRPSGLLIAGTVLAFAASLYLSIAKPSVAYFLLPARAWELAIGAVLASGAIPELRHPLARDIIALAGVAAVLASFVVIRSDTIFPGWAALMPCLGTAGLIHAGPSTWVARRWLASRVMVAGGLVSYSAYLWHWPVLATARVLTVESALPPVPLAVALATTGALSWLSWRFVEGPLRSAKRVAGPRALRLLLGGAVTLTLLCGASILARGFPGRLDDASRAVLRDAATPSRQALACGVAVLDATACKIGNAGTAASYALIGDSHALALAPAMEGTRFGIGRAGTLAWSGACPLLEGAVLRNHPESRQCTEFKRAVLAWLKASPQITRVFLAGRWPFAMTGALPEAGGSFRFRLVDNQTTDASEEETRRVFIRSLQRTVRSLTAMGKEVYVVGSVPEQGFDVPRTIALSRYLNRADPLGVLRGTVAARAGAADSLIARSLAGAQQVRVITLWSALCPGARCEIARDGAPLYSDDDHLSIRGAVQLVTPVLDGVVDPS
jgi:peptidoglycan/LPS O-acetylase OafA/YrhL